MKRIKAAVIVPLFKDDLGRLKVLLIQRTDRGVHGGQLAFPGGKIEFGDSSPLETALRETYEEIGLEKSGISILEALPFIETYSTNFIIYPFLAQIQPLKTWKVSTAEVKEVLTVNLEDLQEKRSLYLPGLKNLSSSVPVGMPFYPVGDKKLWGVSFRILKPLIPRLLSDEWTFESN